MIWNVTVLNFALWRGNFSKELLDRLMEGRSSGDLFSKDGILAQLTKALADRALKGSRWTRTIV